MSNKELIVTYEFGVLSEEGSEVNAENEKPVSKKSFENLWNFVLENQGSPDFGDAMSVHSKNRRRYIKIGRYVGTIQTKDGLTIEILPKIYEANGNANENEKLCRRIFLQMLSAFHDIDAKTFQDAQLNTHENFPIFEVYISRYLDEVEKLFASGIKKDYVRIEDYQRFLKGKLLVHKQICKNSVDKSRFAIVYSKFYDDIPQNRIIVSTLHKLANISRKSANVCRCYSLLNVLSEIPPSRNIPYDLKLSLGSNRLYFEYRYLIVWSNQFLLNRGFATFSGDCVNQSLLFSAEKLFESFIAHLFKKYASDNLVSVQHRKYFLVDKYGDEGRGRFRLRPDIVVESNNQGSLGCKITIIDTKWKNLDSGLPDKNYLIDIKDMYQLYAYGQKYHLGDSYIVDSIPNLVLIYPYTEKFQKRLGSFSYEEVKEKYGLHLVVFPFNLADFEDDGYKKQVLEILKVAPAPEFTYPIGCQSTFEVLNNEVDTGTENGYVAKPDDRYMLIGFYRNRVHLDWICNNHLYNVRYDERREGSFVGINIIPSRVVLYNNLEEKTLAFTVNQSGTMIADGEKMIKDLKYPVTNPSGKIGERYKLFSLGPEIKHFKKIDILQLKENNKIDSDSYAPFFVKY